MKMLTDELKIELEDLCNENNLTVDFDFNHPINMTVRKSMQVRLFEEVPEEAYLRLKFNVDSLAFEFVGNFNLDDKLFSKLASKIKKLHYIFLQEHYAQKNYRFKNCIKPIFNISNGDYVALVKRYYEG
jgi:hypothetical protein